MHIGIDIGGSNLAAGVVDENGNIIGRVSTATNVGRGLEAVVSDIIGVSKLCVEKAGVPASEIKSIGVGAPGVIDRERGVLLYSCNIPFAETPIAELLKREWRLPVYVENDANCAALGELYAGAARGASDVVLVTIGTGIGGGIIIGGKLYSGAGGAGAEIGHMVINIGGERCACGRCGCWEAYASAPALCRLTRSAMQANPESVMWAMCSGSADEVTARTAFEALKQGDETGRHVVDMYIGYLSTGIVNITNLFRPELICLGGGVSNEEDRLLLEPVREYAEREVYAFEECPVRIIKAELGNDAGIIGAAFLYRQQQG